jgi:hypothetical protein
MSKSKVAFLLKAERLRVDVAVEVGGEDSAWKRGSFPTGEKLAEFYGKGFRLNALPKRTLLNEEPKASLYAALDAATKDTQKGSTERSSTPARS